MSFERVDDFHRLLLPDDRALVRASEEVTDTDCAEVEILGCCTSSYIAEKKTPSWPTRVPCHGRHSGRHSALHPALDCPLPRENSLGRLWHCSNRPGSRIREHMTYYIEGEVEADFLKITKPRGDAPA